MSDFNYRVIVAKQIHDNNIIINISVFNITIIVNTTILWHP